MGMRTQDFWNDTPQEFFLRLEGFLRHTERQERDEWERTRIMAYYTAAPHLKKQMTMTRFFPLPWDNERPDRPKLTPEELERLMRKLDKGWPQS